MPYLREINGLRGLLAFWVLLGHWSMNVVLPYAAFQTKLYDNYAVDLFILVSGFCIAALLQQQRETYGVYIKRRFLRIFPVYLFYFFLSILLFNTMIEFLTSAPQVAGRKESLIVSQASINSNYWEHIAAHVVALHGLVPMSWLPYTDFAFLPQAWSISLEWQFYLIAPFLVALLFGRWSVTKSAIIFAILIASIPWIEYTAYGFIGRLIHLFIIGILSELLVRHLLMTRPDPRAIALAWFGLVVFCLCLRSLTTLPYVIWASLLAVILLKREYQTAALTANVLSSPAAQWFGDRSYSLYLCHMIVLAFALRLLRSLEQTPHVHAACFLVVLTIGSLIVAHMSYHAIELPFIRLGKRMKMAAVAAPA